MMIDAMHADTHDLDTMRELTADELGRVGGGIYIDWNWVDFSQATTVWAASNFMSGVNAAVAASK